MAPLPDLDDAAVVHLGAAVAVLHRHGGEGDQYVQPPHPGSGPLHRPDLGGGGVPQLAEELILQGGDAGLSG